MGINYGYIRVSARDQNIDRQLLAMKRVGISNDYIYVDKESGKDFNRPEYKRLIRRLNPGDCIYVLSIDRLGRNYEDIRNQWAYIVKKRHTDIVVMDMPLLDTRMGKDLVGVFLSDIVLEILSFVAENERNSIRRRQAEGIEAAKLRGVKFGRPRKPIPDKFILYANMYIHGDLSGVKCANELGIPACRFYRYMKEYRGKNNVVSV